MAWQPLEQGAGKIKLKILVYSRIFLSLKNEINSFTRNIICGIFLDRNTSKTEDPDGRK